MLTLYSADAPEGRRTACYDIEVEIVSDWIFCFLRWFVFLSTTGRSFERFDAVFPNVQYQPTGNCCPWQQSEWMCAKRPCLCVNVWVCKVSVCMYCTSVPVCGCKVSAYVRACVWMYKVSTATVRPCLCVCVLVLDNGFLCNRFTIQSSKSMLSSSSESST